MLPVKFDITPKEVDVKHSAHSANIGPVTSLISDELSKENWAFGGGAATGAAIGTAILPGVGTAIGLFLGLAAGAFAAPDANEVKQKVKSKLNLPLKSYFRSICNDCISNFSTYINDVNRSIEVEIYRYYTTYNSEIQKRIDHWKNEYNRVQANMQQTKIEMADIDNRKSLIKNIITKLNNL
mgnify:CR=1 FL=1